MLEEDGYINKMGERCYDYWYRFLKKEYDFWMETKIFETMKIFL